VKVKTSGGLSYLRSAPLLHRRREEKGKLNVTQKGGWQRVGEKRLTLHSIPMEEEGWSETFFFSTANLPFQRSRFDLDDVTWCVQLRKRRGKKKGGNSVPKSTTSSLSIVSL